MHGNIPAEAQRAIFPDARLGTGFSSTAQTCGTLEIHWFKRLSKSLWPSKPAAALHFLTEVSERTCHSYVAGERDPSGDFVAKLLWSSDGGRVISQIMLGCKQPWWRDHQLAEIHFAARAAYDAAVASKQLEIGL
jgi:hypothetical protein